MSGSGGARTGALVGIVLALTIGCGDNAGDDGTNVVGAESGGVATQPGPPQGNVDIQAADLPDCLRDPAGCTAPVSLPACLEDDGCAAPPTMNDWTCPNGWNAETITPPDGNTFQVCTPPDIPSCPKGEVPLGDACTPIGPTCPTGAFPAESDLHARSPGFDGETFYVTAGGAGDGSAGNPFGTLAEALQQATDGDIIALGSGTLAESTVLEKRVAILGSCVGASIVASSSPTDTAPITVTAVGALISGLRVLGAANGVLVDGGEATLENVEVVGAGQAAIALQGGGVLNLRDAALRPTAGESGAPNGGAGLIVFEGSAQATHVLVEGARTTGVVVEGANASFEGDGVIILDTKPSVPEQESGVGFAVTDGAGATLVQSVLLRNRTFGVYAKNASLTLRDVTVRDTLEQTSDAKSGNGVLVQGGASLVAERLVLERNRCSGLVAVGADTELDASQLVLRSTRSCEDRSDGRGIEVFGGAEAHVGEAWIHDNRAVGLIAAQPASTLVVEDAYVVATKSEEASGYFGRGLWLTAGGTARVTRTRFLDNASIGAGATGASSTLELTDVEIRRTQPRAFDDTYGRGIEATLGAEVTATRTTLSENHSMGLFANDPGTMVTLSQVRIDGTLPRVTDQTGGYGLAAWASAQVDLEQVLLVGNHAVGLYVDGAETVTTATDLAVRATEAEQDDGKWGIGVLVTEGATVEGERVEAVNNRTVGLLVTDPGSTVTLMDALFADTRVPEQYDFLAPGYGAAAMASSELNLVRATVRNNRTAGVVAGDGAVLTADTLHVRDTQSDADNRKGGEGLIGTSASTTTLNRAFFESNRSTAIAVYGGGATMQLQDVVLEETLAPDCASLPETDEDRCVAAGETWAPATGLWVDGGASATMTRFEAASSVCGLWVGPEGTLDARHGVVQNNAIGANVRNADLDLDLVRGPTVRYRDNAVNLDSFEMNIPVVPPTVPGF